jgi:hypothetical protein
MLQKTHETMKVTLVALLSRNDLWTWTVLLWIAMLALIAFLFVLVSDLMLGALLSSLSGVTLVW